MEVRWVQGKMTAIEKAEAVRIKNATATMKYPHSLWTYLDGIQEFSQGRDCYWFLRVPECQDDCQQRFTAYQTIIGEEREVGVYVGVADNNQVIDREAPLTFPLFYTQWILNSVSIITGFKDLQAVTFVQEDCPGGCTCDPLKTVYAVGNDGTGAILYISDDALGSLATATQVPLTPTPLAITDDPTEIYTNGKITLIAFADDASPLLGVSGGLIWSVNNSTFNFAVDDTGAALTDPFYFVEYANGRYVAGGGNGTLYESFNGRIWYVIPNSISATATLVHAAYDKSTTTLYIAGFDGAAGLALEISGDSLITDISVQVAPSGRLFAVAVLGDDHVAFGGEYGYYAESYAASERSYIGSDFGAGVGNIIYSIAGKSLYTWFSLDNVFYTRSIFTDLDIDDLVLNTTSSIVGNIQDIAVAYHPEKEYIKRIRAVTDAGEVIAFEDCRPNLCDALRVEGIGAGLT